LLLCLLAGFEARPSVLEADVMTIEPRPHLFFSRQLEATPREDVILKKAAFPHGR
jgi:hypothetical protein